MMFYVKIIDMNITSTQEMNFAFYKQNAIELSQKYDNRYLVINEENVVWDFATVWEAYDFAISKYKLWQFIIQHSNYIDSIQYISRIQA
jgi:hypothetical protein